MTRAITAPRALRTNVGQPCRGLPVRGPRHVRLGVRLPSNANALHGPVQQPVPRGATAGSFAGSAGGDNSDQGGPHVVRGLPRTLPEAGSRRYRAVTTGGL